MQAELLVLRLIHILGALFWLGSGLFMTFFLAPALASVGPMGGQIMASLERRKMFTVTVTIALLTILSGFRLMQITSGGFAPAYFERLSGQVYLASGIAAVLAFLVGVTFSRPTAKRMAKLSQSAVSGESERQMLTSEIRSLQRRMMMSSSFAMGLLLFAAAGMAIARYL